MQLLQHIQYVIIGQREIVCDRETSISTAESFNDLPLVVRIIYIYIYKYTDHYEI